MARMRKPRMTDFNDMAMVYPIDEDMPTTPRLLLILGEHEEVPDSGLPGHLDVCRDLGVAFAEIAARRHAAILISARIAPELRDRFLAARSPETAAMVVGADLDEEVRQRLDDRAQALYEHLTDLNPSEHRYVIELASAMERMNWIDDARTLVEFERRAARLLDVRLGALDALTG